MGNIETNTIRLDVFGREVLVLHSDNGWLVYYLGPEGKRRPAKDIIIPSYVTESDVEQYIADLCHEWASPSNPEVKRLA